MKALALVGVLILAVAWFVIPGDQILLSGVGGFLFGLGGMTALMERYY